MATNLPSAYRLSKEVRRAIEAKAPLVALETTVITHGLPYPENLTLANDMQAEVRRAGALPAMIGLLGGNICVGLEEAQIERLATSANLHKISTRDFGPAVAGGWSGGTTVAGTMLAAWQIGIRVFATGGIGGVHRQAPFDVSADLQQLASTPMIVVCAGAKAILDLPATLEYLETCAVPVIGYQTDDFPAFFSRSSGLKASARVNSPAEAARLAKAHWSLGLVSAVLITAPPPEETALPLARLEQAIQRAIEESQAQGLHGQGVTPFLLKRVSVLTGGESLRVNLALLRQNAYLAAEIACQLG